MGLYLLMMVVGILLLTGTAVRSSFAAIDDFTPINYYTISSNSDNNNDDSVIGQESRLQICCSWSTKLSDGILKYSIDAQEEDEQKGRHAIINAIKKWDTKIEGLQLIEEEQSPSASDIQITFGELGNDETGNRYYDFKNNEGSLMSNLVIEDKTATISECEINGVYAASSWKFIDSRINPEHPQRMFVPCCSRTYGILTSSSN